MLRFDPAEPTRQNLSGSRVEFEVEARGERVRCVKRPGRGICVRAQDVAALCGRPNIGHVYSFTRYVKGTRHSRMELFLEGGMLIEHRCVTWHGIRVIAGHSRGTIHDALMELDDILSTVDDCWNLMN